MLNYRYKDAKGTLKYLLVFCKLYLELRNKVFGNTPRLFLKLVGSPIWVKVVTK